MLKRKKIIPTGIAVGEGTLRKSQNLARIFVPTFNLAIDFFVTLAGGGLQPGPIFDGHSAAGIVDQPGFLEDACGDSDTGAPRA
jgi:hypothetical protein